MSACPHEGVVALWSGRQVGKPGYRWRTLRDSYEDTRAAAGGADLLVSHPLAYATRLVAEKAGGPWASTMRIRPTKCGAVTCPDNHTLGRTDTLLVATFDVIRRARTP